MDRPAQENTSESGEVKSAREHGPLHTGDAVINIAKGGTGQTTRSCVARLTPTAHQRTRGPGIKALHRSIVFARPHDNDPFGGLDMAHEDVLVLTTVAMFSADAALDARLNFRDY
jgi:hypothetical protein